MLTKTMINTLERNADALRYLGETCEDNGLKHILNQIAMELKDAADELQGNPLEDEENLKKVLSPLVGLDNSRGQVLS